MKPSSIGTADIRETNRRIALRTIWRFQPISRADLARLTRINKSSISVIVAGLLEEGLVLENEFETTKIGRTPIALVVNESKHAFLAIDVRVSGVAIGLYDLSGNKIATRESAIRPSTLDPQELITCVAREGAGLCADVSVDFATVHAIGVAVVGEVDRNEGVVFHSPHLGWELVELKALLRREFPDAEVIVDNSANLALRAEVLRGPSRHERVTGVYIDINERVETGIILSGKVLSALEFGMGSFGRTFVCAGGADGSPGPMMPWEKLVSVPAILERYRPGITTVAAGVGSDYAAELRALKAGALAGHPEERALLADVAHWLAVGISNIIVALRFPVVIIGGQIREIWDVVSDAVYAECETLTESDYPKSQEIRLSTLEGFEALEGAGLAAIGTVIPLDLVAQLAAEHQVSVEQRILEIER